MKKLVKNLTIITAVSLSAITLSGCDPMLYGDGMSLSYDSYGSYSSYNPTWAPDYYNGARYYYLPDIESYYDISNRSFVMLRNGQWQFVSNINSYYPSYDLNNGFVVVLNTGVYQPWMHHQYYHSHYPRYYYRDYYDHNNIPYVRGFNENQRSAIYWSERDRNRAREWDNQGMNNNRNFRYSDADRRVQQNTRYNNQGQRYSNPSNQNRQDAYSRSQSNQSVRSENQNGNYSPRSRNAQNQSVNRNNSSNYFDKTIGQPVKVDQNMRMRNSTNRNSETTKSSTFQPNSNSGRR